MCASSDSVERSCNRGIAPKDSRNVMARYRAMGPFLKPSQAGDQRRSDSRAGGCSGMDGMANQGRIPMVRVLACAVLLAPLAASAQARISKDKPVPLPLPAEKTAPPL